MYESDYIYWPYADDLEDLLTYKHQLDTIVDWLEDTSFCEQPPLEEFFKEHPEAEGWGIWEDN